MGVTGVSDRLRAANGGAQVARWLSTPYSTRASASPRQEHEICAWAALPSSDSPPSGLTTKSLHDHGSRYEHLCGQFPVIPRVERARMIHLIAYVPPRDLRPPFCPPQLVAHSDYLGDHRLARSAIFRVSDEVWREEGST